MIPAKGCHNTEQVILFIGGNMPSSFDWFLHIFLNVYPVDLGLSLSYQQVRDFLPGYLNVQQHRSALRSLINPRCPATFIMRETLDTNNGRKREKKCRLAMSTVQLPLLAFSGKHAENCRQIYPTHPAAFWHIWHFSGGATVSIKKKSWQGQVFPEQL